MREKIQAAVHPAQVAGLFYPAEPDRLRSEIAEAQRRARPPRGVAPKLVIAPHAGLAYSGAVAASAFGAWAQRADPPARVVIVGPAHRVAFRGLAVHPAARWATPLGEVPVAPPPAMLSPRRAASSWTQGPSRASTRSKCIS